MIEEQAAEQPGKDKDRQEKAAARQKLLNDRAAARQRRVEVSSYSLCACGAWCCGAFTPA